MCFHFGHTCAVVVIRFALQPCPKGVRIIMQATCINLILHDGRQALTHTQCTVAMPSTHMVYILHVGHGMGVVHMQGARNTRGERLLCSLQQGHRRHEQLGMHLVIYLGRKK